MKKALKIVKNIFVTLVVLIAICMMIFTIISVTTLDKTDRSLFGFKAFIVLTDSMSRTDFKSGDLVVVKEVNPATLEVDDIISYRSTNLEHYYEVVTHKIRKKVRDRFDTPGFITYGTTTETDDDEVVTYENVLGKYCFAIPGLGLFFQFMKTTPGYIICILLPFLLIILIQAIHSVILFKRYKSETLEEMAEERRKFESEKMESEEIKKKLLESEEKAREFERELQNLKKELTKGKKSTEKKATTKKSPTKKAPPKEIAKEKVKPPSKKAPTKKTKTASRKKGEVKNEEE